MRTRLARFLYALAVPGGLLLLGAVVVLEVQEWRGSLEGFIRIYPYIVFLAGVLLGWRFDRSRVVLALVVLLLADQALLHLATGEDPAGAGRAAFHAVSFLLPLNWVVLSWLVEPGLGTRKVLRRLSVIAGQALFVVLLTRPALSSLRELFEYSFAKADWLSRPAIAQPAGLAFLVAGVVLAFRWLRHRHPMESGFLWALVAVFLGLSQARAGLASRFYLGTAGLILVVALIEATYLLAYRDELTGLPGRRALSEAVRKLGDRYAVAMVDIDHFKKFNDTYGHAAGDQLLRMVSSKLARMTGGGRAFRYGGEEFAVLFSEKSVEEVLPHLEAVRKNVEEGSFALRGRFRPRKKPEKPRPSKGARKEVPVTISIGVAERSSTLARADAVIKAADEALYRAKKGGRNQIRT